MRGHVRTCLLEFLFILASVAIGLVTMIGWTLAIDGEYPPSHENVLDYLPTVISLLPLWGIFCLLRRRGVEPLPRSQVALGLICMAAAVVLYFSLPARTGFLAPTTGWIFMLLGSAIPWLGMKWLLALCNADVAGREKAAMEIKGKWGWMVFPALCLLLGSIWWARVSPKAFDPEVWSQSGRTTVRWQMVDDLLKNHIPLEMTLKEFDELTGNKRQLKPSWPIPGDHSYLEAFVSHGGRLRVTVVTN